MQGTRFLAEIMTMAAATKRRKEKVRHGRLRL
jgi:hypothetical protein